MYRIRLHGRGGQGIKTGSRVLGRALFLAGFEVQDAPRYGAERRGAPIFAYVRASRKQINDRGIITRPDLIVAADDSLIAMPAAGVLQGIGEQTVLLLCSREQPAVWQERLNVIGTICTFELPEKIEKHLLGVACAGGAAALLGFIDLETVEAALRRELAHMEQEEFTVNLRLARNVFEKLSDYAGIVQEGRSIPAKQYSSPDWLDLPFEDASISGPAIHAAATSDMVNTGIWRTSCPVIDYERCNRCWWICSTFCPDGAISIDKERRPHIDYKHCKGCLVCLAQCPSHAIELKDEKRHGQKEISDEA